MQIPIFPLPLLPLPGELVPLHIFEPRYKQLLRELETSDMAFGIYCHQDFNHEELGSLMKLESVLKRYTGGESDIVVRCIDVFYLEKYHPTFRYSPYPGGEVVPWNVDIKETPGEELYEAFLNYRSKRNIIPHFTTFSMYQIVQELNLTPYERYRFLLLPQAGRRTFLLNRLKFQQHILLQEEKSKNIFHLN